MDILNFCFSRDLLLLLLDSKLLLDTFIGIEILISNSKILLIISKISFLFVVYKIVFTVRDWKKKR